MEREWMNMDEVETICREILLHVDPAIVDYNHVLLDHFFPSLKGKPRYLMTSLTISQRTHDLATCGRFDWNETTFSFLGKTPVILTS